MHGLETEFAGQIGFAYLDIDDAANDEFKSGLGYQYQPHLFLLDAEGNILNQWIGLINSDDLRSAFQNALQ